MSYGNALAQDAEYASRVTPARAKGKFIDFLRNFRSAPDATSADGRLTYRDALDQVNAPTELKICFDDMIAHDGELAREVRMKPNEYLPVLEDAVLDVIRGFRAGNGEEEERRRRMRSALRCAQRKRYR